MSSGPRPDEAHDFHGIFVEANAVSPRTAREIAAVIAGQGASVVDGGIIGPPPGSRVGEMEEIAATFADAGLPDGFHRAAAEVYRRAPQPS